MMRRSSGDKSEPVQRQRSYGRRHSFPVGPPKRLADDLMDLRVRVLSERCLPQNLDQSRDRPHRSVDRGQQRDLSMFRARCARCCRGPG